MNDPTIVGATLISHRKPVKDPVPSLEAMLWMKELSYIYVNVEEGPYAPKDVTWYPTLYDMPLPRGFHTETWRRSLWRGATPEYDQDQRRLLSIVTARNMAIDFALSVCADYLLFIDADVRPHPGGLEKLLELDTPLCGGYVPGRGCHKGVHYVFPGSIGMKELPGNIILCGHGTCGYMLIHRSVFSRLRFRWGVLHYTQSRFASEDDCYCSDAKWLGYIDGFYIHKEATADHVDDPEHPLTSDGVCKENFPTKKNPWIE